MDKPKATLHELPKAALADIPKVLRGLADEIEKGVYGKTEQAALVIESSEGKIETFGCGAADYYRGIALFNLGISKLTEMRSKN